MYKRLSWGIVIMEVMVMRMGQIMKKVEGTSERNFQNIFGKM